MLESLNQTLAAWLVLLALVIFSVHTHAQIQGLIAGEEQPNQTLDLNATNETQINETLQIPEQNLTNETFQPAQNETLPEPQEEGQGVEITSEPGSGAQPPPASGPPGSPSSAPPSAPQRASVSSCANLTDNNTVYTLTNNLNQPQNCDQFPLGIEGNGSCIIISGHNVTLDCAGFSITGPGTGAYCSGVLVNATTNVTVKNCNIEDFSYGIGCSIGYRAAGGNGCSLGENHSIFNNTLKDNTNGLYGCFNSSNVTENRFYNNFYYGAAMVCDYGVDTSSSFSGSDNLFRDNVANSTGTGFYMYWDFHHNIFINNTAINGYPPYSTLPAAGFKIGGVVSDYTFRNTSHNTFINNTANNNTIGFWITGNSYNNTLRGNIIKYNNDDGMSSPPPNSLWIRGPYGEEIGNATGCGIVSHWYDDDPSPGSHEWVYVGELHAFNNTIENNTGSGMLISGSNNNITENSIKYNGMYGISLASNITITEVVTPSWGLDNCNITNNTIVGNNWTGIRLHHTRKAFVKNNTVTGNNISGIVLDDEAKWNIIENNSVSNNSYNGIQTGIFRTMHYSFAPSYNVIQNNTITGTGEWSFLSEGYQNNFTGNIIGTLNPTNMSFKDTGLDNDINISGVDNPPATGSLKNISKYVNVTVWGPSNRIFLNVSYTDSDVSGMDEGGLRMCWYNETSAAWELAPVFSDINGVDTVSNTVYAKLEPSGEPFNGFWYTGLYAPLEVTKMPNTTEMILNSTSGNNYTTDNLNCWARGEDEYNLTLGAYWRWWNGSSLFLEGYTSGLANSSLELITTLESGNTSEGETWTCSVFFTNSTRNETDWNNRSIIITTPPNNPPDTIEMTLNSTSSNNYTTDDLHCWAKGSDAENTTLAAWWQWWNGSTLKFSGYTPGLANGTLYEVTTLGSGNTSEGETWKCSVLFFDGELNESAWNNRSLVTTAPPTPPDTIEMTLNSTSSNNYTTDDLHCWAKGSDAENTTLAAWWQWWNGSSLFLDGYTPGLANGTLYEVTTLGSGNTSEGETWKCSILFFDGEDNETDWNNRSLTIGNTQPQALNPILNSSDDPLNRTTGTLQASWTFYDSDAGDTQQAFHTKWYNNSAEQPGLENQTTVQAGNTTKGQAWNFSVRVFDGTSWSSWNDSNTLTILNTPPSHIAPLLNATTINNLSTDDLYCWNQSTSDDDNDPVTNRYRWFKNGLEQAGLENQTVVLAGNTSSGEAWICEVTPYDDEVNGTPLNSSPLGVENTPPDTIEMVLNATSANNLSTDNLTCYARGVDGQNLTLGAWWRWYKDGALNLSGYLGGLNNNTFYLIAMLESGNTSHGETWKCSILFTDGTLNETAWNNRSLTISSTCTENGNCDTGFFCNASGKCQPKILDGAQCKGQTSVNNDTEEDAACQSGYCDNDGVDVYGRTDDGWCFTPLGGLYDSEDANNECEVSANPSLNYSADEYRDECVGGSYFVSDTCINYSEPDDNQGTCDCIAGAGYWSLGGETSPTACCDDGGENKRTRLAAGTMDAGYASNSSDDACCDASNDCVNNSVCYTAGDTSSDIDGDTDNDYCNAGTWDDCQTDSQCQAGQFCSSNDCKDIIQPQMLMTEGIVEPVCCADGTTGSAATCDASPDSPSDRYCTDLSANLPGTHNHRFTIRFSGATAPGGTATCNITLSNGTVMTLSESYGELSAQNVDIGYTVPNMTSDGINRTKPWLLTACEMGGGSVYLNTSLDTPIFVHGNEWTWTTPGGDGARALGCYLSQLGQYFNNTVRCHWDGDLKFANEKFKNSTLEVLCHDTSNNDAEDGTDCSDVDCVGIPYFTCPNAPGYFVNHPSLVDPYPYVNIGGLMASPAAETPPRAPAATCDSDTNICQGTLTLGAKTISYYYTYSTNESNGSFKIRFNMGQLNASMFEASIAVNNVSPFSAYGKHPYTGPNTLADDVIGVGNVSYQTKELISVPKTVDQVMYMNYTSVSTGTFEMLAFYDVDFTLETGFDFLASPSSPTNWNESDPALPKNIVQIAGVITSNHSCNDDVDNDLDTYIDCQDSDCLGVQIGLTPESDPIYCNSTEDCWDGFDNDGDGDVDCSDPDCDGSQNPDNPDEYCVNGSPNTRPDTVQMILNSTPGNNLTTDDLHCWAKGLDPENTTLAAWWQWWNGSSLFLDGYTPGLDNDTLELVTILGSGNTSKGETWKCSVLFFDGELNESAWNNRSLTILNTPPGHTQPVLNSSSGNDYTSDDLYCWNQSTSDDDNDPVTNRYRWYKEGSEQAGLENQTVVTSGNTSVGEAWICEVTPYDDEEAGTPRNSSSLTIQSAPPPPPPPAPGGPTRVIPTPNYIINITKYPSVIELLRGDTKTFSIEVRNTGDAGLGDVNVKADSECPGCKFTTSPTGVDMIAQKTRQFLVTVNAVDAEAGIYSLTLTALSEEKANSTRRLRLKVLMCKPGSKKCLGNSVGTCSQDGFSWTPEYCEYGCNEETLACNKPPVIEYPIPPEVGWKLIWFVIAAGGVVYCIMGYREHRKHLKRRKS